MIRGAFLVLALCACAPPPAAPPSPEPATATDAVSEGRLPDAVAAVADAAQAPILSAQEAVQEAFGIEPATLAPPEPAEAACLRAAAALIVRWEVTSPAYYTRALQRPVWPKGQSGVTWAIGYDGGHQTARTILDDWADHRAVDRLATTTGITGSRAGQVLPQYRDILTPYDHAYRVFEQRSAVEYHRRARRAFSDGFDALKPNACGALVDLVYNRGTAMTGDSRREMRNLRDKCVPVQDYACMAREIRSMSRLWRGTVNEAGLTARRESEALLIEEN